MFHYEVMIVHHDRHGLPNDQGQPDNDVTGPGTQVLTKLFGDENQRNLKCKKGENKISETISIYKYKGIC